MKTHPLSEKWRRESPSGAAGIALTDAMAQALDSLLAERDGLAAVVARLPKMGSGEPMTPGIKAWKWFADDTDDPHECLITTVGEVGDCTFEVVGSEVYDVADADQFYPTKEAAMSLKQS